MYSICALLYTIFITICHAACSNERVVDWALLYLKDQFRLAKGWKCVKYNNTYYTGDPIPIYESPVCYGRCPSPFPGTPLKLCSRYIPATCTDYISFDITSSTDALNSQLASMFQPCWMMMVPPNGPVNEDYPTCPPTTTKEYCYHWMWTLPYGTYAGPVFWKGYEQYVPLSPDFSCSEICSNATYDTTWSGFDPKIKPALQASVQIDHAGLTLRELAEGVSIYAVMVNSYMPADLSPDGPSTPPYYVACASLPKCKQMVRSCYGGTIDGDVISQHKYCIWGDTLYDSQMFPPSCPGGYPPPCGLQFNSNIENTPYWDSTSHAAKWNVCYGGLGSDMLNSVLTDVFHVNGMSVYNKTVRISRNTSTKSKVGSVTQNKTESAPMTSSSSMTRGLSTSHTSGLTRSKSGLISLSKTDSASRVESKTLTQTLPLPTTVGTTTTSGPVTSTTTSTTAVPTMAPWPCPQDEEAMCGVEGSYWMILSGQPTSPGSANRLMWARANDTGCSSYKKFVAEFPQTSLKNVTDIATLFCIGSGYSGLYAVQDSCFNTGNMLATEIIDYDPVGGTCVLDQTGFYDLTCAANGATGTYYSQPVFACL